MYIHIHAQIEINRGTDICENIGPLILTPIHIMYEKEEYNVIQRRDMSTIHIHTMYEREEYSVKHSVKNTCLLTYNIHMKEKNTV